MKCLNIQFYNLPRHIALRFPVELNDRILKGKWVVKDSDVRILQKIIFC